MTRSRNDLFGNLYSNHNKKTFYTNFKQDFIFKIYHIQKVKLMHFLRLNYIVSSNHSSCNLYLNQYYSFNLSS